MKQLCFKKINQSNIEFKIRAIVIFQCKRILMYNVSTSLPIKAVGK